MDHSYTQKGLSWNHLKNIDSLRAEALKNAANILDLEISMSLADVQESWHCETDYDEYSYRSKRKHYDEEDRNEEDIHLSELIDNSTILRHWIDHNNHLLNYKDCYISDDQISWTKATNEFKPFESEYEGWMGNYGNTVERWYHRAAIILWRKQDHYSVLFEMDANSVLLELLDLTKIKSNEEKLKAIINSLLPCWSEYVRDSGELSLISAALKLAAYVNDPQLAFSMLKNFNLKALNPKTTKLILALQKIYGTTECLLILKTWGNAKHYDTSLKCENISKITSDWTRSKNTNKELVDWLLSYQLEKIQEHNTSSKKEYSRVQLINTHDERKNEIIDFIKACIVANNDATKLVAINHIIDNTELYPIFELVDVLKFLKMNLNNSSTDKQAYEKLSHYVIEQLKNEKANGLRHKNDWSIREKWSCDCKDCLFLRDYLQSNLEKQRVWPLAKDRRMHIHRVIDGLGIPVTHETKRTGSPHQLILTKTDKLYSQAKHRFDIIEKELCFLTEKIEA